MSSLVAPIDNVYNTLDLVKATSTQKYSEISKLKPEIEGNGSFTFFAPSNEAWEALDEVRPKQKKKLPNISVFEVLTFNLCHPTGNKEGVGQQCQHRTVQRFALSHGQ